MFGYLLLVEKTAPRSTQFQEAGETGAPGALEETWLVPGLTFLGNQVDVQGFTLW